MTCPEETVLVALHDGELPQNQARAVEEHKAGCASCRARFASIGEITTDLAAPVTGALRTSPDTFADEVLARLDRPRKVSARFDHRWSFVAVAAAASVMLAVGARSRLERHDEWSARGGSTAGATQPLLRFGRVAGPSFEPISQGARIAGDSVLAVEVGAVDRTSYLLAFLVDAEGERHWIYPSYTDQATRPSSVPLPNTSAPRILESMVRPDRPAKGQARLVAVVLPAAESIDFIEDAMPSSLTRAALVSHYPNSVVISIDVEIF